LLKVIDTHAHVDELENIESALSKAKESGVVAIIAVGSNHRSNQKVMESVKSTPLLFIQLLVYIPGS